jgi:hypothetical protein
VLQFFILGKKLGFFIKQAKTQSTLIFNLMILHKTFQEIKLIELYRGNFYII